MDEKKMADEVLLEHWRHAKNSGKSGELTEQALLAEILQRMGKKPAQDPWQPQWPTPTSLPPKESQ